MSDDVEWYVDRVVVSGGLRLAVVRSRDQHPLEVICETTPELAARIVADHNRALAARRVADGSEGERLQRAAMHLVKHFEGRSIPTGAPGVPCWIISEIIRAALAGHADRAADEGEERA